MNHYQEHRHKEDGIADVRGRGGETGLQLGGWFRKWVRPACVSLKMLIQHSSAAAQPLEWAVLNISKEMN